MLSALDFRCSPVALLSQEPYNVERILWLLSGSDSHLTKTLMERFSASKSLRLPEDVHRKVSSSHACACAGA